MIIPPGWWVGVGVGVGAGAAWGSVMIVWIRGLSWMIVGPVAGLAFFVVFRRFHVGELGVFILFYFFVCWNCLSSFFVLLERGGRKRILMNLRGNK